MKRILILLSIKRIINWIDYRTINNFEIHEITIQHSIKEEISIKTINILKSKL